MKRTMGNIAAIFLMLAVAAATAQAAPDDDLLQAIENENISAIRTALQQGANPNTLVKDGDLKGLTALMLAVASGNSESVRVLLENKADVNMALADYDYNGITALMLAAGDGRSEIVRILLEHGANPNMETKMTEFPPITALGIAVVAFSLGREWGRELEREQFSEMIRDLLEYHADIDDVLAMLERENSDGNMQGIAQELRRIQQEIESKRQQEEQDHQLQQEQEQQRKALEQELPKIKSANTANELFVMAYKWEKSNPQASIAAYQEILDRFPDADAAIKAIDRLDQLGGATGSSVSASGELTREQAEKALAEYFEFPRPVMTEFPTLTTFHHLHRAGGGKEAFDALMDQRIIASWKVVIVQPLEWLCVVEVKLSPQGQQYAVGEPHATRGSNNLDFLDVVQKGITSMAIDVKACDIRFHKITGIAPVDSEKGKSARVEFEWSYANPTPFLAYSDEARNSINQVRQSAVLFNLYDDGWRLDTESVPNELKTLEEIYGN